MRFDPRLTREEMTDTLDQDARATWGVGAATELRPVVETTAAAIWRVAQEQLETTDVEP